MRLVVTALTGALFYVSVKSASIGPRPCTTPEVSARQSQNIYLPLPRIFSNLIFFLHIQLTLYVL